MKSLPENFSSLAPFVNSWSHATELQRSQQRWTASVEEFESFYKAMLPMLDEILEYLDQYEVGAIPNDACVLYHLTLAFAEAAPHNELYKCANEVPNSFAASRFIAAHGQIEDR
jgi:hypothetical protein